MAAASAFVLTGCTETDLSGDTSLAKESAPSAIQFSAKTRNAGATRTTGGSVGDITTTTLKTGAHASDGFGVMAYVKGTNGATDCYTTGTWNDEKPNFMYNQQVTYSTDHWTYTPVKFWPNDFANGNVDTKQGEAGEETAATGSVNSGKVSFFAYAPFVAPENYTAKSTTHKRNSTDNTAFDVKVSGTAADEGIVAITANDYQKEPEVKYVLKTASLDQAVDLLWGVRAANTTYTLADGGSNNNNTEAYNTDLTKQAANETIDFLFKHALAKIGGHTYENPNHQTGLQVILDLDNGSTTAGVQPGTAITGGEKQANTLVTVESIKIRDLKTYAAEKSETDASDLINSGWFNIATGTWSENTTKGATYNHAVDKSSSGDYTMNPDIAEPADASKLAYSTGWTNNTVAIPGVITTAPTDVYTEDSKAPGLLLIPSPDYDQTLVVTVKYIVRTFDDHLATSANNDGATNGTWSKVEQTITNKVTIPANSLKSNKFYKLLIHLGLTSVKFSATVADWEENTSNPDDDNDNTDSNKDIYLPSNTIASTVSVPAGGNLTVNTAAEAVEYTINLTGATDTNAFTAAVTSPATITPATGNFSSTTQAFTVSVPANDGAARDFVVTITDTTAEPDVVTTVTITQAKQP